MKIVLIAFGSLVGLVVLFVVWRNIATARGARQLHDAIAGKIDPLIERIRAGGQITNSEIDVLAANAVTRNYLYLGLVKIGRKELFPEKYHSLASHAESDLVVWLMHPNELGAAPAEIILASVIQREEDGKPYQFCVFKFRESMDADSKWLAGVAGPYWGKEDYTAPAPGVFSRFDAFESNTPEGHVAAVEKLLLGK